MHTRRDILTIKIDVDEKLYKTTQLYLIKKGTDEKELDNIIKQSAADALSKAFNKNVPKAIREYIDLEHNLLDKKKSVSQDTPNKEVSADEQRTSDRQDN